MGKQYLNGVLYGTGEIIKFSPYIYSLEEREIGVWTDGKPLYEKTFNISPIGYTTIGVFITLASVPSNIQFVTKIEGVLYNSSNTMCYPLEHEAYDEKLCIIRYNRSENSIDFCSSDTWPNGRIIVTIQYTKTTDTPGSGHYTTNGGEAHHYSTEEQVVGTWIDGKTLYEKTLIPTSLTSDLATEDFTISNVEQIVRCSGRISNIANTLCANVPFYINNDYRVGFETRVQDISTVRCKSYFGAQSPSSYKITDITIQYTKSTD